MRSGLVAEFTSADDVVEGAKAMRALGYDKLEAHTPFPIPELDEPLGVRRTRIPYAVFLAGLTGAVTAFVVVYWTNGVDYPLDVGGRPLNSIVADVPLMFETTVLFAGITSFLLVLLASGMPRLHHPVFEIDGIEKVSMDGYLLGIDDVESVYNTRTRQRLLELGAVRVHPVGVPEPEMTVTP